MKHSNLRHTHLLSLSLLVSSYFSFTSASYAELTYDFDDGTLQGWTIILPENPNAAPVTLTSTTRPTGNNNGPQPQSGDYLIAPIPWGARQIDGYPTLYVRSPEFFVDTSGDLTFHMAGGQGTGNIPESEAGVLGTPNVSSSGSIFVALRRVSDGRFVLTKRRGGNGNGMNLKSFTVDELAPFVGELCTLDLVDSFNGGWGWTALDTVSIPGAVSYTHLTLPTIYSV